MRSALHTKLISLLLIPVFVIGTGGITFYSHYCSHDEITDTALLASLADCDHDSHQHEVFADDCCSSSSECKPVKEKDDCCEETSTFNKIEEVFENITPKMVFEVIFHNVVKILSPDQNQDDLTKVFIEPFEIPPPHGRTLILQLNQQKLADPLA